MTVSSTQFFNALAGKQYDELIQIYGKVAIDALNNYQMVQMRWNNRERQQRASSRSSREEKFDDTYINPFSTGYPPLRNSNENITPSFSITSGASRNSNKGIEACGDLIREFTSFLNHPELIVDSDLSIHASPSSSSTTTTTSLWDAEQIVRDAVSSLTEMRPPSDFVLYPGGIVINTNDTEPTIHSTTITDRGDGNGNLERRSMNRQVPACPPLFDGAVANATPNFGTNGGGGLGTALHAVAALDHPLIMALLLAMGADARACHTAFRRLVQHEAACNGSIQCLTLLLELGNRYGEELFACTDSASSLRCTNEKPIPTESPESVMDFQFFSRRAANMKPVTLWKRPEEITSNSTSSVLSLLRLFHSLVRQVEQGILSELDAARMMSQQSTLTHETKVALAIQCGYNIERDTSVINTTSFPRRTPSANNSDGHGNTPLHWAAFKNETACISLLLKYRADPNARAHPSGWAPLHDAAYSNGRDAIALLIDAGALVDARASSGATPLCFAAQEDAADAAELLLIRGADLGTRCAAESVSGSNGSGNNSTAGSDRPHLPQTRFSGYTPLHYCAHYNASRAAKVLLQHFSAHAAMEIRDLNGRLPIHVAVARGSSGVLRELLVAGARVETRSLHRHHSTASASPSRRISRRHQGQTNGNSSDNDASSESARSAPTTPQRRNTVEVLPDNDAEMPDRHATPPRNLRSRNRPNSVNSATPVSSPILRSMIPSQPIQSSKPWNCLSQRSIDECRQLISEVEQNWTPDRHSLFTPADRRAVAELLRVGKRLEAEGSLPFTYLWPEVLSFCGRGWFEAEEDDTEGTDIECFDDSNDKEHLSLPTFC